jgi:hypothetical protein
MSDTMLVRIAPTNNRESHYAHGVMVKKADGWCEVDAGLARKLERERMNPLNPNGSQPVFEVQTKAAAKAQEEAEKVSADKPGSVEEPKKIAAPAAPAKNPKNK